MEILFTYIRHQLTVQGFLKSGQRDMDRKGEQYLTFEQRASPLFELKMYCVHDTCSCTAQFYMVLR